MKRTLRNAAGSLTKSANFIRTAWATKRICLAAVLLSSAAPARVCDGGETIRVLCYNIHYGQGTDGRYDIQRLARVISKTQPDLVALQEVDVGVRRSNQIHQARELAKHTGMAVRYGPTQHYQGGLYGNAVLTRFDISDVLIQPLPYTASSPKKTTYPRGAIAVSVRTPQGQPLRFVSTHFQHNLQADRVAEARAINRLFAGEQESLPTILAGDMNATPQSEPIKILQQKWTAALEETPAPSAPSINPKSRIDYVFFRPADRFRLVSTRVIHEPTASDHLPVFAEFELQNRRSPQ